jgi:uncharacterized protein YecT (DUF1311 family)
MTQGPSSFAPLVEPPDTGGRGASRIVVSGVLAAILLGVGLGLWARPAPDAPPAAPARASPPARPILQIVVDDMPAPLGAPLEVLPRDVAPVQPFSPAYPAPVAPARPAAGLVRVDAEVAVEAPPMAKPRPAAIPVAARKPVRVEAQAAKPERPRSARIRGAEAASKSRSAPAAKAKPGIRVAAKSRPDRPDKPKSVRVAKASAKASPPKAAAAKTRKKIELASAAGARRERPARSPKALRPAAPKVEKAKAPPPKAKPTPRGEGPMRVARAGPCASADPGEAIVCADRRLGARDRQLQQAYRNAEAAGVPASALRRQQARWLEARAAAAREAPWAVDDVYVARISELNDLTRDARDN